jgi:arylsulfatase A-like enzyme
VHGPYKPPPPYQALFVDREDLVEPPEGESVPVSDKSHVYDMIPKHQYLEGHLNLNYYVAQYDGGIRYVDSLLSAFFDALKADGLYDSSLIVITADHGESLTEHRYLFDHGILTDEVMRVPLVIKFPKEWGVTGRFAGQAALIDLLPTFLESLQVEPSVPVSGTSLFGMIRGEIEETAPYAFCCGGIMKQWAIRSREWKYVRMIPGSFSDHVWETCPDSDPEDKAAVVERLYNLKLDPQESLDVTAAHQEKAAEMAARVDAWIEEQDRLRDQIFEAEEVVIDEKTERELKALGYVNE